MATPREVREAAMQLLFAHDLHGELRETDMAAYWELHNADAGLRKRAENLARDVSEKLAQIDGLIAGATQNYAFDRINVVDRNIMRIAVFELLHRRDVPPRVVMNEAIEIARKFATEESGRFVNGVVDRIAKSSLGPEALLRREGPGKHPAASKQNP